MYTRDTCSLGRMLKSNAIHQLPGALVPNVLCVLRPFGKATIPCGISISRGIFMPV